MISDRSRFGFTLVELLLVVALVGLLAGLATQGARGLLDRGRVVEGATSLELAIKNARRESKRLDVPVVLSVQQAPSGATIVIDGVIESVLPGSVTVTGDQVGGDIRFEPPFGSRAGGTIEFQVNAGGRATRTVVVAGVLSRTWVVP